MGCWNAPFETQVAEAVRELMKEPLSATNAIDSLYGYVGDDDLFDSLDEAEKHKDTDVRPIVLNFLQTWFGENGDNLKQRESWRWNNAFDDGALTIFKEMLTDWNQNQRFPVDTKGDPE